MVRKVPEKDSSIRNDNTVYCVYLIIAKREPRDDKSGLFIFIQ